MKVSPSSPTLYACLGGIAATAVDVAVLAALVELGAPVALAAAVGVLAGAVANFVANKYVAFRDHSPLSVRQVGAFGLVAVGTALLMAVAMQVVAVWGGVAYLLAKAACAAVLFFVWSLPAQKRFVFAPALDELDDPSASYA